MTVFGYARLSTEGQTLEVQVQALKAAGCDRLYREEISGTHADRPQLARLLTAIAAGDTLIVTRLDRLARSTRDLLEIVATLIARGAAFRSLGDSWADTTNTHGHLMLTVLAGLAEFERDLIRQRTGDGRKRARARAAHIGRPPKLTPRQQREALAELAKGHATQADLARRFKVNASTISRLADKAAPLAASRPPLDAATERAARAFMKRIEGRYSARDALVFGSRARGTHQGDSDADLAVILKGKRGDRYKVSGEMAGIAFDVMLETGILVDPLPLWEDELKQPERFGNRALIENIKREGLHL